MSSSQTLGGASRCGWVLGPSLDKIIKNAAWRKHSHLVSACKSALDKLDSLADDASDPISCAPLYGLSSSDAAEFLLQPLIMALESASAKVIEPALDCAFRLFSFGLIRGCEIKDDNNNSNSSSIIFRLIDSVCKCAAAVGGDEAIELAVLKVLLSAVRSPCIHIRGDCLVFVVRSCYNVYLGGRSGTNQICAKSVLAQMMIIVFTRVEENSMLVDFKNVSVFELLEFADRNLNEGSSIQFAQNFINEIVEAKDSLPYVKQLPSDLQHNGEEEENSGISVNEASSDLSEYSKIREDGFMLYKNLCKLSMKFSSQENPDDQILLRGKILSLELLNVIMGNAAPIWCTNERFLNAVKQYLCLSLLKNSALSVMTVFQLLCSIFWNLLSKFRSGLKSEIGIFFPMLILRVLENVLQPSFLQKMTVLNLLEKIAQDSQIVIDTFVNYDCDVDAPNIFERTVNGLLKTALGPPPGSVTSLSPAQDMTFRHESVKCLVRIIKSMGSWMDQQLKVGEFNHPKISDIENLTENPTYLVDDANSADYELHSEANSEFSDTATLEQRRAYKLEIQKGVALFNRKPSKGIEFLISTKKVNSSPEEVASFLKSASGLNESMIGDYFGEREEFPMKVMHAYVDSFNFEKMGFAEAIRFFLRGFRLPGEAQKIDRIMEKFAERYCKCNPSSFTSADTAYVLAYSVIMLNTDAHNSMVKDKMSKADFIRNNRGIDDGKDLPEDYLGALYDQVVKNEIKMKAEPSAPQSKHGNSLNKLLGLDGILNLVWKQTEEKPLGANGYLLRHIQEQFKAKSAKSEVFYYAVADPTILRFMVEVCWGPMLAAFSVTLDQSDDKEATSQCLQGFRHAVHVTAMMGMQTQRDAFVTTVAKFTYLHCAADMKQKNVDAVKAMISIAIEDGNYLQEAWEHILTCLSRFEHLQLLGEGAPSDASFLNTSNSESEEKTFKYESYPSLKKKGTLQNLAVMAVVRGGSYDSTSVGVNSPGLVSPEQINSFISNLYLLDQIGNFELNHIFAHSQRLNSEAIVAFVRSLCKVSMSELQSPTDPRVFSLTKIVEVAHYNMNRIRLVWSRIWNVLSEFFVSVGLSENLSVAIFVMDSLRQLAMKFLEREELVNYNFQNEFLRPFTVVMQKSCSTEIRELIVRCISQMVLSRVNNIKSGWKSVFMVFTAAAADEMKSIVLLAFETMEKIVREYFPYITETEALTFTDCVRCLITFTNSRFNSDVSLNAIAFLRFCAVKLADGGLSCNEKSKKNDSSTQLTKNSALDCETRMDIDEHMHFWIPLLSGLSKLTSDPRAAIRKSSLEVLFNILKDHGHLFSQPFWANVFKCAIFPIFSFTVDNKEAYTGDNGCSLKIGSLHPPDESIWDSETSVVAAECLTDLFVHFFDSVRPQLHEVISILARFIRSPGRGPSSAGVAALMRLTADLRGKFFEEEWRDIFLCLEEAARSSLPAFMKLLKTIDSIEVPDVTPPNNEMESSSDHGVIIDGSEDENLQTVSYIVSRMKIHIALQLLIIQVVTDLYKMHWQCFSVNIVTVLLEIYSSISSHAHELNSQSTLLLKLDKVCCILEISDPPLVHFENESYMNYLNILHDLLMNSPSLSKEKNIEAELVSVCKQVLQRYLECSGFGCVINKQPVVNCFLPLGSAKKEELAARTPLILFEVSIVHWKCSEFLATYFNHWSIQVCNNAEVTIKGPCSGRHVDVILFHVTDPKLASPQAKNDTKERRLLGKDVRHSLRSRTQHKTYLELQDRTKRSSTLRNQRRRSVHL
ncbi:brefeldin a-inhibited guanine nucleotide-exchange protein 1 [Phtheirospermum japonicum]|uniref:Brefeldin a-inhibited guanine nucleotide-exchange protein 1 n=1 Tax=Phtheirospermum japonicum TaxID=374723 RepID=A0A830CRH2_9LAMI|nr:brefeldin a-inhibited guanine nucleotide-exchange protein 1 [Phtheirospermum japonicum]